jgi:ubiquinone/menaquinone biosynthesis C-methylase UbiE
MKSHSDSRLRLLPRAELVKTGPVDYADWSYRPLLGIIQRIRFRLAASILRRYRLQSLLEVGYGSGVFLPELARHCDVLYGLDTHSQPEKVAAALARSGLSAKLSTGSVMALPFADAFFDAVVAISALEFVEDLDLGCSEIKRVLKPDGLFLVISAGHSLLGDLGLKLLTGKSAQTDFADRRQRVLPTLKRHFSVVQQRTVPRFGALFVHLYTAIELRNASR